MGAFITEYAFYICLFSALLALLSGIGGIVFKGRKKNYLSARYCLFIMALGFSYGCVVTALGKYIGENETLRLLSIISFILKVFLMPLIFTICAVTSDIPRKYSILIRLGNLLFLALGLVHTFMTMLQTEQAAGLLYYTASSQSPRWALVMSRCLEIFCILLIIIFGMTVLLRKKNIWLLAAGLFRAATFALGFFTDGGTFLMIYETAGSALMFFLLFIYIQTVQNPDQSFLK